MSGSGAKHLEQVHIERFRAAMNDSAGAEFAAALDDMNALTEVTPGAMEEARGRLAWLDVAGPTVNAFKSRQPFSPIAADTGTP
jgi:hypothetical protein